MLQLLRCTGTQLCRTNFQHLLARIAKHPAGRCVHLDEAHGPAVHERNRIGGCVHGHPKTVQVSGAGLHLLLQDGAVVLLKIAERFQAQKIPHPQAQFGRFEGFGQELFGACFESRYAHGPVHLGGQHDDGNIQSGGIRLQQRRQFIAIHAGHHDVQQNEIRLRSADGRQRLFGARRHDGEISFGAQQQLQQLTVVLLIIDDEDGRNRTTRCALHLGGDGKS